MPYLEMVFIMLKLLGFRADFDLAALVWPFNPFIAF